MLWKVVCDGCNRYLCKSGAVGKRFADTSPSPNNAANPVLFVKGNPDDPEPPAWVKDLYEFLCAAKASGKHVRNRYYGISFSPDALVAEILKGRYRWGVVNWDLIDPPSGTSASDDARSAKKQTP